MKVEILYRPSYSVARVSLDHKEKIQVESGAMVAMSPDMGMETEAKGGGLEEIIPLVSGERVLNAWETGDINAAPMMVGQSIGLIHSVPTCAELLKDMMQEAVEKISAVQANIQS